MPGHFFVANSIVTREIGLSKAVVRGGVSSDPADYSAEPAPEPSRGRSGAPVRRPHGFLSRKPPLARLNDLNNTIGSYNCAALGLSTGPRLNQSSCS
jgi:hypothetical protein